jgi:putative ABC transport system permease protein
VVRDIVASFDRTPRGAEPMRLDAVSRDAFLRQQTLALLLGVFSVLSLLLTAVGLFGVLAYFVSQRRRELGIRAALGATRRHQIWLVGRQTLIVAGAGMAIGLPLALAATGALQGLLFEVRATDPISFNGTAIFLLVLSALASWVPAVRAASTDPAASLRDI